MAWHGYEGLFCHSEYERLESKFRSPHKHIAIPCILSFRHVINALLIGEIRRIGFDHLSDSPRSHASVTSAAINARCNSQADVLHPRQVLRDIYISTKSTSKEKKLKFGFYAIRTQGN